MLGILLSPVACLLWIIVGGVAGSLAHQIMGARNSGFAQDVIMGLIGAVLGGFLLSFFRIGVNGSVLSPIACIGHIMVATFGACVLIGIGRVLSGNRTPAQ
jgi:uncharacterized membrane protein YeaQ/YmgE (transglycosylase-associated protein family)